jgi:uncharacterized protein (DUF2062 family)
MRRLIQKINHFVVHQILHADDSPHRLALGVALGFFVAWTPTIGFQMIMVILLATALRANNRVGIPIVWISNPLTLIPIYLPNYWLGHQVLDLFLYRPSLDYSALKQILFELFQFKNFFAHFYQASFWRDMWDLFLNISIDLWLGSVIAGLFLGSLSYIISYKLILWYRTHHPQGRRIFALLQRRRQRDARP